MHAGHLGALSRPDEGWAVVLVAAQSLLMLPGEVVSRERRPGDEGPCHILLSPTAGCTTQSRRRVTAQPIELARPPDACLDQNSHDYWCCGLWGELHRRRLEPARSGLHFLTRHTRRLGSARRLVLLPAADTWAPTRPLAHATAAPVLTLLAHRERPPSPSRAAAACAHGEPAHVSHHSTCPFSGHVLWRQYVATRHGPNTARRGARPDPAAVIDWHPSTHPPPAALPIPTHTPMSDDQRQCRRASITPDVELGAALALADMAGGGAQSQAVRMHTAMTTDEDEMASTRLSLQLGRVGIQSSSCSSGGSSAGRTPRQTAPASAATGAHGPRPRHVLTEVTSWRRLAEKEAKRLRRVLANRESARQTILRRQAIRDELARKVADLSSENETIKKVEKDLVLKEYLWRIAGTIERLVLRIGEEHPPRSPSRSPPLPRLHSPCRHQIRHHRCPASTARVAVAAPPQPAHVRHTSVAARRRSRPSSHLTCLAAVSARLLTPAAAPPRARNACGWIWWRVEGGADGWREGGRGGDREVANGWSEGERAEEVW
ncbi:hypothetical protein HU200_059726 [Digitaria exilis]|uniref:BZIP domain-containing protein n=1 Tax=Digitaria exilis TaxID=1010633 RepID=A0A835DZK5_9POAL|nr:hypothetical protein HU200_059726 [Digitaria exilis]